MATLPSDLSGAELRAELTLEPEIEFAELHCMVDISLLAISDRLAVQFFYFIRLSLVVLHDSFSVNSTLQR